MPADGTALGRAARDQAVAPGPTVASCDEERLRWLAEQIRRNRFLPVPPTGRRFIGDGDFVAIGVEFLGLFVALGELAPDERVLDLGCGIGRMAVPMTQYLEGGSYDGVDIVADGIAWCRETITAHYPEFRFHHLDLHHPIYNPDGLLRTTGALLPFADGAFDFVLMTSVVTHLHAPEVRAYLAEIRRVMAPGARLFVTSFMLNRRAREGLLAGRGALPFDGAAPGPELHADAKAPTGAVAFEEEFLLAAARAAGLRRRRPPIYGRWSGRTEPGATFQDIDILEIAPDAGTRR